jgi:hypothetical protein
MENNPGYGQLDIFDSDEEITKQLGKQRHQGYMSELIQLLDEMVLHVNPLAESYKRKHQLERYMSINE